MYLDGSEEIIAASGGLKKKGQDAGAHPGPSAAMSSARWRKLQLSLTSHGCNTLRVVDGDRVGVWLKKKSRVSGGPSRGVVTPQTWL